MRMSAHQSVAATIAALALTVVACSGGDIEDADTPATPTADEGVDAASPTSGDAGEADPENETASTPAADLLGAGASFPDPVYQEWIGAFQAVQPTISVQYEAIGSSGGREQFINQQTLFAGTDSYMSAEELVAAEEARGCPPLHIPAVFGGVVVAYNIEGVGQITLDAATTADIFSGAITNISDPAIAALNEGVELPDQELTVNVRADGSGTTQTFTAFLESEDEEWAAKYGSGDEVDWFDGVVASDQNDGVAAAISQQPGAIGYLSLDFAVQQGLTTARMINADGNAVQASPETVGAAADGIELPEDLRFDLLGIGGDGYPISTATWLLAWECGYDDVDAEALKTFITWALTEGDGTAADLGYAPLSASVEELSLAKVDQIDAEA